MSVKVYREVGGWRLTHALRWRRKEGSSTGTRSICTGEILLSEMERTVHRVFALFARVDKDAGIHVTS